MGSTAVSQAHQSIVETCSSSAGVCRASSSSEATFSAWLLLGRPRQKVTSEFSAPPAEHRLTDIEAVLRALHVDMGMGLVGVERKGIPVPVRELLLREIAYRCQEFVGRRPRWHR